MATKNFAWKFQDSQAHSPSADRESLDFEANRRFVTCADQGVGTAPPRRPIPRRVRLVPGFRGCREILE